MPIFDFSCRACGATFELLVRKNEPACPKCGSSDLDRHFSLPAIQSESTHGLAMRAAKKRDQAQGKERIIAQQHYAAHHDD